MSSTRKIFQHCQDQQDFVYTFYICCKVVEDVDNWIIVCYRFSDAFFTKTLGALFVRLQYNFLTANIDIRTSVPSTLWQNGVMTIIPAESKYIIIKQHYLKKEGPTTKAETLPCQSICQSVPASPHFNHIISCFLFSSRNRSKAGVCIEAPD